jgi:(p)ppGpp synthase/HD superfamily hydrolase
MESIEKQFESYKTCIGISIEDLSDTIRTYISPLCTNLLVSHRIKDLRTLQMKLSLKRETSIFSLVDVYGIRILTDTVEEVYSALQDIDCRIKGYVEHDYIAQPKVNYARINAVLRLLKYVGYWNQTSFEIQITTKEFHALNEALHAEYHRKKYAHISA